MKRLIRQNIFCADSVPGTMSEKRRSSLVCIGLVYSMMQEMDLSNPNYILAKILSTSVHKPLKDKGLLFHHIDWKTDNNVPSNLLLMDSSAHHYLHWHDVYHLILIHLGYSRKFIQRVGSDAFKFEKYCYSKFINECLSRGLAVNLFDRVKSTLLSSFQECNEFLNGWRVKSGKLPSKISPAMCKEPCIVHLANNLQDIAADFINDSCITRSSIEDQLDDAMQVYENSKKQEYDDMKFIDLAVNYLEEHVLDSDLPEDIHLGLKNLIEKLDTDIDWS